MNSNQVQGKNEQLMSKIKAAWGRLTNDDVALFNGSQEEFYGKLREEYGIAHQEGEKQIKEMEKNLNSAAA